MIAVHAGLAPMSFAHLAAMTGEHGLYEHAAGREPRLEHGYCTDDVARALTVVVREPERTDELERLTGVYLMFLERAVSPGGDVHNRMSAAGQWTDQPSTGDWWGRAIAGLGSVVRHTPDSGIRARALRAFHRAARRSATDVRACAFAAIGAADVRKAAPDSAAARSLLVDCLARIPRRALSEWDWPEPRLRYANAALCRALIVGGDALGQDSTVADGIAMLTALLRIETSPAGQLSVTGTHGRAPGEPGPLWDQQPIEPAVIADACADALIITGDARWAHETLRAWAWFVGENDAGTVMADPATGAGYDGLQPGGRNENCGAESTLAAISTHQNARTAMRWLS